ncbi:MAG: TonB-dependent receptor [Pseudomonadota bacterium]
MRTAWYVSLLLPLAALPMAAQAEEEQQDLSSLSIEELAQLPVRSASKQEEPLSAAPTSLFVITDADIARANGTSLTEVLRLAPNLHVEKLSATQTTIAARGFAGFETSNKLLVLIDGRSVYSTLHSGVFWDLHSPLLEDLQQIEVISGPGGTLYGPNAVNGVINILSKDAADTQGALVRGTASANERTAGARYGFKIGDSAALRVYANYYDREDTPTDTGFGPALDESIRGWQAGFRADLGSDASHVTLQGDAFDNETFMIPGEGNHGYNILARWTREIAGNASVQFQGYYDFYQRRSLLTTDRLETADFEGQVNFHSGAHSLVGGLGIRTTRDEFINDLNAFQLDPRRDRLWIANGFVQDRFALSPHVSVVAGIKLEGSSFSGLEVLPNLRFAWQPNDRTLFWTSVSRAVRTPSRIDRNLTEPTFLAKAPDFESENLVAVEAGYRGQPGRNTSLSVSLYFNRYEKLRSVHFIGFGTPTAPFPLQLNNDLEGDELGVEAWGTQQLTPWWRVSAGATLLKRDFGVRQGGTDIGGAASIGRDPSYQVMLRSQVTLPQGLIFDAGLRAVDSLPNPHVDGYVEADARLAYRITDAVELYVAGDNLLHASHVESNDVQRTTLIERNISLGARLRF